MAGNSAGSNLEGFVYISMNAFYNAAITFTGQNYGAKKFHRIKRVLLGCLFLVTVVGLVLGLIFLLLSGFLSSLYSPDPVVIEYSVTRLRVVLPVYFTCGIMEVLVGVLRGMGYSIVPMLVSFLGACVFRIVWVYTVFEVWNNLTVLYISYPVSWVLTSAVHLITYLVCYRKIMRKAAAGYADFRLAADSEESEILDEVALTDAASGDSPEETAAAISEAELSETFASDASLPDGNRESLSESEKTADGNDGTRLAG